MINRKSLVAIAAAAILIPSAASAGGSIFSSKNFGSKGWGSTQWGNGGSKGGVSLGGHNGGSSNGLPTASGGSGGDPVSVPEPASMALLGSGLAMLAGRRLKRGKA